MTAFFFNTLVVKQTHTHMAFVVETTTELSENNLVDSVRWMGDGLGVIGQDGPHFDDDRIDTARWVTESIFSDDTRARALLNELVESMCVLIASVNALCFVALIAMSALAVRMCMTRRQSVDTYQVAEPVVVIADPKEPKTVSS